jgi:hypothetical protein
MKILRIGCILFVVLATSAPRAEEGGPATTVTKYFDGLSDGVAASQLVEDYWASEPVIFQSASPTLQIAAEQYAAGIDSFQDHIRGNGWTNYSISKVDECLLKDDLALVNVNYKSEYKGKPEKNLAVVYILAKSDIWRISSIIRNTASISVVCNSLPPE